MTERATALIMVFLVIVIIAVLSSAFFFNVINENRLVRRYEYLTQALWLAEAGIAQAIVDNLPTSSISGYLYNDPNYSFSATVTMTDPPIYQIVSTGSINIPPAGAINRSINAWVRTDPVTPSNFEHAIRTTGELVVKGSVDINGEIEEYASLSFTDLFEHSMEDIRANANYLYTDPPNDVVPVEKITWVDVSSEGELRISSDTWEGGCGEDGDCGSESNPEAIADNGGILVVAGDAQITGGTYYGIIYVIGKLRMSGNPTINGTILVESEAEIDTTVTGNVTINYDSIAISNAVDLLEFIAAEVVAWQEQENE